MDRRAFVAAVGAALAAGCTGSTGGDPQITPVETNDDGEATLGELRYLLESNDAEQYRRIDVTGMTHRDGTIELTYASEAADANEFTDEMGTIIGLYAVYVGNGGEASRMEVSIEPGYEGQPGSFHVKGEWARQFHDDELGPREYINKVLATTEGGSSGTTTRNSSYA